MLHRDNARVLDPEVSTSRDSARTPAANYRELFRIGSGGFATISVALAQGIEGFTKVVVLKTLREELSLEPGAAKMFLDEARLLARMNHPNVVQVYEVFRQGNSIVIAMEYVDGQTLSAIQTRCRESNAPLSLDFGISILIKVLAALHYAHTLRDFNGEPLGLIHRDVSPQNVMVTYDGQVKLLDFGIAKLASGQCWSADQTCTGVVKGKLTYMAPEQYMGPVDHRSDIFAVGVMLWELAAGRRYWAQVPEAMIMRRLACGELPHLCEHIDMDAELARICEKALALDVENRYANAGEMQEDLERYLAESGIAVNHAAIGQFVGEACTQERNKVEQAIRSHLSELGSMKSGQQEPAARLSSGGPESGTRPSRSKVAALAGFGAALVAGASILGLAGYFGRVQQPEPRASTSTTTGSASAVGSVRLRARAQTSGAVWYLDDKKLGSDPIDTRVARDDGAHMLRAEAEGYLPFLRAIRIDADMDVVAALAQKPQDPAQESLAAATSPRKALLRSTVSRVITAPPSTTLEPQPSGPVVAAIAKKENPPPALLLPLPSPSSAIAKKETTPAAPPPALLPVVAKKDSVPSSALTASAKKDSLPIQFGDSLRRSTPPRGEHERRAIESDYPGGG